MTESDGAAAPAAARARPGATAVGLVVASHAGPTAVVTGLSAALLAAGHAPLQTLLLATAAVLTGQLSVGWSNDWVDAQRDRTVGRADKPTVTGGLAVATVRRAAFAAGGVCVVLSLAAGRPAGVAHVVAVAVAWAYNLRLKDSALSPLPYAVAFGLLPVFLVGVLPGPGGAGWWLVAAAACLGVGAHVANVLPDLEDDAATGVRGLPHRLGRTRSGVLAPGVLLAGVLLAVLGPAGPARPAVLALAVAAALAAVAAGGVALTRPRSRAPFALSMVVAGLCVAAMVSAGSAAIGG